MSSGAQWRVCTLKCGSTLLSVKLFFFVVFFFFSISERSLILKDTIQKKKPRKKNKSDKQIETIEPYTIIYILLRIMEAKYVYRVAFGKPAVEYLRCFFYREGSFTDDNQFQASGAAVSQRSGETESTRQWRPMIQNSGGNSPPFWMHRESQPLCLLTFSRIQGFWSRFPPPTTTYTHTRKVVVVGCVEDIISASR